MVLYVKEVLTHVIKEVTTLIGSRHLGNTVRALNIHRICSLGLKESIQKGYDVLLQGTPLPKILIFIYK